MTTDIILSSQIVYYRYFYCNRIDTNDETEEDNKGNINELSKTINRDLFNNDDNIFGNSGNLKIENKKEIKINT